MLILSEKYYSANKFYGLSFFFDTLVAPLVGAGFPVKYLFMDTIRSQEVFERQFDVG